MTNIAQNGENDQRKINATPKKFLCRLRRGGIALGLPKRKEGDFCVQGLPLLTVCDVHRFVW